MQKKLDSTDIKILEALGTYGPRSIRSLAERIDTPAQTIRDRVKRLKSHFSLYLQASIYHTYIGLKKAFVFAKAYPGYEDLLWECLKAEGYYLYLGTCYAPPESYYGIYGIPIDHTAEFEQFVREIEKLKVAESVKLFWSTCIQTINLTDNWFDHESNTWRLKWNKWIQEIENQGTQLPYTLIEPDAYPQKADKVDILILKELEKDATTKLRDIAKMVNVSPQKVQYHFSKHVIEKGLIEGYAVLLPYFDEVSDIFCFRFNFDNGKDMAKFALSLQRKPFARATGKIFGENALFVQIYLPRKEFGGFTESLSRLIKNGLLRSYDYVIEDPSKKPKQQTIRHDFFEKNMWIYDHEKHIENLRNLVRNAKLQH